MTEPVSLKGVIPIGNGISCMWGGRLMVPATGSSTLEVTGGIATVSIMNLSPGTGTGAVITLGEA